MFVEKLGLGLLGLGLLLTLGGFWLPSSRAEAVRLGNPNLQFMAFHSPDRLPPLSDGTYPGISEIQQHNFGNLTHIVYDPAYPLSLTKKLDTARAAGLKTIVEVFWAVAEDLNQPPVNGCTGDSAAAIRSDWKTRINDLLATVENYKNIIYALYFDEPYCKFSVDNFREITKYIREKLDTAGKKTIRLMVMDNPKAFFTADLWRVPSPVTPATSAYYQYISDLGFDYYFTKKLHNEMPRWKPTPNYSPTNLVPPNFEESWGIYLRLFERLKSLAAYNQRLWLVPELYISPADENPNLENTQALKESLPYALNKYYQLALQESRVYGLLNFVYHAPQDGFLGVHEFLIQGVNPIYYNQPLRDRVVTIAQAIKNNQAALPSPFLLSYKSYATASGSFGVNLPQNAVDDNFETAWNCGCPAPAWLQLDLGAEYKVSSIMLNPLLDISPVGAIIKVQAGTTETLAEYSHEYSMTLKANTANELILANPPTQVRFLRLTLSQIPSSTWVGLREVEVYGVYSANLSQTPSKISQNAIVTASNTTSINTPQQAVDADSNSLWNSGGIGPQAIELDLRNLYKIKEIKLRPSVQPEGVARIIIYAGLNPNPTKIIWQTSPTIQLTNATVIVPNLSFKVTQASFRYIKIETVSIDSPTGSSWVAWRDIEIIGTA